MGTQVGFGIFLALSAPATSGALWAFAPALHPQRVCPVQHLKRVVRELVVLEGVGG